MSVTPRIAIIGAGIAGLGAAYTLRRAGIATVLFEAQDHPGGRAHTVEQDGFYKDIGAGFLAGFYRNTLRLIHEMGLGDQLVPISSGGTAILRHGRPIRLSRGLYALDDRLLPLHSRLRMLHLLRPVLTYWSRLDPHDFVTALPTDTHSVSAYALRQLDGNVLERLLQPALDAIFYWSPEETSQAVLFILLKAALGLERLTLRRGVGQLAEALAAREDVRYAAHVVDVSRERDKLVVTFVQEGQKENVYADGLVSTVPAPLLSGMMSMLNSEQRTFFDSINYSSTVIATVTYGQSLGLSFQSLLVPRSELNNQYLTSITSMTAKNPAQVPPGKEMLRLYASGERSAPLFELDDEEIGRRLLSDLRRIQLPVDLERESESISIQRWRHALPKFDVGHLSKLARFRRGGLEPAGIVFAGDFLGGPFIEGALTSGIEAAQRLVGELNP